MEKLLGKRVLPIVKRNQISVSWASAKLHGVDDMHRACHMDTNRVQRMIQAAIKEERKDNKTQEWVVWAIKADGTFDLRSDYGYEKIDVDRSDFRILKLN